VVTGGCMAQYRGSGTVNGVDGYTFMLTLRDGDECASTRTDAIRMKITGPSGLRYDTRFGESDDIGPQSGSVQDIASGSIVIHRWREFGSSRAVRSRRGLRPPSALHKPQITRS
jgi:hypothetical protein